jgi:phosphopantothenate-cysteine ligase
MRILITSGGTKIPIDKVRDITNMSKGTFGTKIAEALLRRGHDICFVRAKNSKSPMRLVIDLAKPYDVGTFQAFHNERVRWIGHYREAEYSTFEQYRRTLQLQIGIFKPDVIVLAAAVSDYGVENPFNGKIRSNDLFTIKLCQLPKVINMVQNWAPKVKIVGFKLLVGSIRPELVAASKRSIIENKCAMVVANDLEDIKQGNHKLTLVFNNREPLGYESDPKDPDFLAKIVASHIEQL